MEMPSMPELLRVSRSTVEVLPGMQRQLIRPLESDAVPAQSVRLRLASANALKLPRQHVVENPHTLLELRNRNVLPVAVQSGR